MAKSKSGFDEGFLLNPKNGAGYKVIVHSTVGGGNFNLSRKRKPRGKFAYHFDWSNQKYVLTEKKFITSYSEYFTPLQIKHLNNLIYAKNEIDKEIDRIKKLDYTKKKKKKSSIKKSNKKSK